MLVLYVDRALCGINGRAILIEVRLLPTSDIKAFSKRRSMAVAIACPMNGPLVSEQRRCRGVWEFAPETAGRFHFPCPTARHFLTCRPLDSSAAQSYGGRRQPNGLSILYTHHGSGLRQRGQAQPQNGGQIDPADESHSITRIGVDKPHFLMLAKTRMSSVPADLHARTPCCEKLNVIT